MAAAPTPTPPPLDAIVELITPTSAAKYLEHNIANRRLRDRAVAGYARDMRGGHWPLTAEPIKFDKDGNLFDGQHRLSAVIEAGVSVHMLVVRGVDPGAFENLDTGIRRTFSDNLRNRGELNYSQLAATVRAITAWEAGERLTFDLHTVAELFGTLERHPEIRDQVPTVRRLIEHARLPASVAGVIVFAFTRIDAEDAYGFFDQLATGEGVTGEPAFMLHRLIRDEYSSNRGNRSRVYLTAVAIKAWNKYREGEKVSTLRWRRGGARPEAFPEPE